MCLCSCVLLCVQALLSVYLYNVYHRTAHDIRCMDILLCCLNSIDGFSPVSAFCSLSLSRHLQSHSKLLRSIDALYRHQCIDWITVLIYFRLYIQLEHFLCVFFASFVCRCCDADVHCTMCVHEVFVVYTSNQRLYMYTYRVCICACVLVSMCERMHNIQYIVQTVLEIQFIRWNVLSSACFCCEYL